MCDRVQTEFSSHRTQVIHACTLLLNAVCSEVYSITVYQALFFFFTRLKFAGVSSGSLVSFQFAAPKAKSIRCAKPEPCVVVARWSFPERRQRSEILSGALRCALFLGTLTIYHCGL